jgi:two-component system cell cycle sensor histidine kinase/response regulator CckA
LPAQPDQTRAAAIADHRFPIRALIIACVLTLTALAWFGVMTLDQRHDGAVALDRVSRIEELRGVIVHLDEVLTMSARMAAATGNPRWEERYRQFAPHLDTAITEAIRLGTNSASIAATTRTNIANTKLVAMEDRAFALVRDGRRKDAEALLTSPEYETQKTIYADGITSTANQLRREFDEQVRDDQHTDLLSILAALVVATMSVVACVLTARGVQRWRAQLLDSIDRRITAEEGLRRAHGELETRVTERTTELATANRTLQEEIVERQRSAAALQSSEARTKAIVQSSLDCIVTIDHAGRILDFNPAAELVFGYARAVVLGKELAQVIIPRSFRDRHRQGLQRYCATGEGTVLGKRFEIVAQRSDGGEFPVELAITRLGVEEPPVFTGFIRDISERKRAERQMKIQYAISRVLAESATAELATPKLLQLLCEHVGWDVSALWTVDTREHVLRCVDIWSGLDASLDVFKSATRNLTLSRNTELPGLAWASGKPAWIADVVQDASLPRALAAQLAGLHGACAFPIVTVSGVSGVIEVFSHEVQEPDAELLRTFAVLGDPLGQFFQRRRLEDQLFQSQKLETVGKLAGGIAHEFNSILTAIIGQSELLRGDLPGGSPLVAHTTAIATAAERAAVLTRQLLAYGRKQLLRPEILDVNAALAGMDTMLRHLMGRDVNVHFSPAADLKTVQADRGQFEQVVVNLVMNAADAMPNGGTLTFETANVTLDEAFVSLVPDLRAGNYVTLAISDTGAGMSADAKARAFEPFFSTKGVGRGTGLGLSTCYGIIKQSGGHISVYSERGRGTTFKIYLPQVAAPARPPVQRLDESDLPRGTETILLVEDDPALREMVATLLTRLGYTVWPAANGIEALSLRQQRHIGHIDLLFTDMVMPHMSGKELSERIRASSPHTRILFTSAYAEQAIVHQGVLGYDAILLQKPFTPSALARKLREVLDQPRVPSPVGTA